MRQAGAVHVRLPGDAEAHFAAQVPGFELVGARMRAVDGIEFGLIVESEAGVVDVVHQRLVEDEALGGFHAHRADQHEGAQGGRRHARHFRRDPATEAGADQRGCGDAEFGEQCLVEHGDVTGMAQPVQPVGAPEAGMVRNDDRVTRGQRVEQREAFGNADFAMQHDNWRSAAGARDAQRGGADLDDRVGPGDRRGHEFSLCAAGRDQEGIRVVLRGSMAARCGPGKCRGADRFRG